jgi:hypothetical protein
MPGTRAIFRTLLKDADAIAHAGRGATADENVIARSVLCDEAISFVDGEIASQTALAMTGEVDFQSPMPAAAPRRMKMSLRGASCATKQSPSLTGRLLRKLRSQ